MKRTLLILFSIIWILLPCSATLIRRIDTSEGLSSKRVIDIEKDLKGYMWFLTLEGADRYDGKNITHYPLMDNDLQIHPVSGSNTFLRGNNGSLWQLGSDGKLFHYSIQKDQFIFTHQFPAQNIAETNLPVSIGYIDSSHHIWYFEGGKVHIYQTNQQKEIVLEAPTSEIPSAMVEVEKELYYIACQQQITLARWINNELIYDEIPKLKGIKDPSYLYFDKKLQILVIGTLNEGIYLYNRQKKELHKVHHNSGNIHINKIIENQLVENDLLVATNGAGIFRFNLATQILTQVVEKDNEVTEQLKRSVIRDLYYDPSGKLWIASYLRGVFVYRGDTPKHEWITHNPHTTQSLCNNHTTRIIEDSEGDIWFSTFDGVSCYFTQTKEWKRVSLPPHITFPFGNHLILSIYEAEPGKILAGGYMSKLYTIDKKSMSFSETAWFKPYEQLGHPAHYIRSILKDQEGFIWVGGFPYLIGYKPTTNESVQIPFSQPIYDLAEKDSSSLWVGTRNGLFVLNKHDHQSVVEIEQLKELGQIHHIYVDQKEQTTYIATQSQGLISYNNVTGKVMRYTEENSALNSNRIYCILSNEREEYFLTTEEGVSYFNPKEQLFTNWEEEQGLGSTSFSQAAGVRTQKGEMIFGSINGALLLNDSTSFAKKEETKMIFKDLYLSYERVVPGEEGAPLINHLDDTDEVSIDSEHSIFSIEIGSINFDAPSSILYSWKLDNFYEKWSAPSSRTRIRYMNLNPGLYKLRIRAISKENGHVLEERSLNIHIKESFWNSWKGYLLNLLVILLLLTIVVGFFYIHKKQLSLKNQFKFLVKSLQDMQTPLTLIKAPLQSLLDKGMIPSWGEKQLQIALQQVNHLTEMNKLLLTLEKEEREKTILSVTKNELNNYLKESIKPLQYILEQKQLTITHSSSHESIDVWINKCNMDYVVQSLLITIIKQSTIGGEIRVATQLEENKWNLQIESNPKNRNAEEQIPLHKRFNKKSSTSTKWADGDMGIQLTTQLIKHHEGSIQIVRKKEQGVTLQLSFPLEGASTTRETILTNQWITTADSKQNATTLQGESNEQKTTILLIESDETVKNILVESLQEEYTIWHSSGAQEAFLQLEKEHPEIIISDILLPQLDGYAICQKLKSNPSTSHIPVILLMSERDDESIIRGLKNKADRCIVKPFDIRLLKAYITNVVENRVKQQRGLTHQLTSTDRVNPEEEYDSDKLFLLKVKETVKENLDKEFTIDQLCHAMLISRTSFYTKMKALTNQSPHDFIRRIKMERAEELLKSRRYSVGEIADMLGFNDPKYFTDIFKKHAGVTPSTFMKQQ
ncbi:MAG: helix-turn-helix domain-containing protein [Phocaeicola sp.]